MINHENNASLQKALSPFLENCKSVGFVPTMGALHKGHISLVEQACKENDCVVVSIFVNPTQFNKAQDLEKYPRTLESDLKLLKSVKGNVFVFSPNASELYKNNITSKKYNFSGIENEMEGKHREGHFDGVGTVLNLLFRMVKPNKAYLGEKDFQQLEVVKKLVEIEKLPVSIIGCSIVREKSGLAMSSRNKRLNEDQLKEAALIFKTLTEVQLNFDILNFSQLNKLVENTFDKNQFLELEYFEIANSKTLKTESNKSPNTSYRAFIAVFVDGVRLIDNIALN